MAKRIAGDIGYCLGLGPKSAAREVAGSAFCPLTRVTPPAIVCWIDRSGVRVARRALAHATIGKTTVVEPTRAQVKVLKATLRFGSIVRNLEARNPTTWSRIAYLMSKDVRVFVKDDDAKIRDQLEKKK